MIMHPDSIARPNATDGRSAPAAHTAQGARYALITAARNEVDHIERTIHSVISQTLSPVRWIIVSDGSTDGTDECIERYAVRHPFIIPVRAAGRSNRDFSSKVYALREGMPLLSGCDYDFIGNIDADISFGPDYFERLLARFDRDETLGLAGGRVYDVVDGAEITRVIHEDWSVSGAVQMFRRELWERIGGYSPIERGGEDFLAEVMVRMTGWKVATQNDLKVRHYRRTGTATTGILAWKFRQGYGDFLLGGSPVFEVVKCLYRFIEKPYILAGGMRICGYLYAWIVNHEPSVPPVAVASIRHDQLSRLRSRLPFIMRHGDDPSPLPSREM